MLITCWETQKLTTEFCFGIVESQKKRFGNIYKLDV